MIKKILLDGVFRETCEFEFYHALNLLVGDNGSGKTTILNFITQVISFQPAVLWNIEFNKIEIQLTENEYNLTKIICSHKVDENILDIEGRKSTQKIIFEYIFRETFDNFEIIFDKEQLTVRYSEVNPYDTVHVFELDRYDNFDYISFLDNYLQENRISKVLVELKNGIIYFPTYRRIDWDIFKMVEKEYVTNEFISKSFSLRRTVIGTTHQDIEDLLVNEVKIQNLNIRKMIKKAAEKLRDDEEYSVKGMVELLLHDFQSISQRFKEFETLLKDYFEIEFSIEPGLSSEIKISKMWSRLSTGEKQIITIFLYTFAQLKQLKFNRLILIDEPEISLHINWQTNFIHALQKIYKGQAIISTHSPYITDIRYRDSVLQVGDIINGYPR